MTILFLSVYEIKDSNGGYIYADLIREFAKHGHDVYAVTPTKTNTEICLDSNSVKIIKVKNGQIQKTGKIKKAINLLTLENKTIKAVKKYAKNVKFDLIINMCSNLCYVKTSTYFRKRDGAVNYLLLKDIFPQNAVDIAMMKTTGVMGFVYRRFRKKEKKLYNSADYIGCMSRANVEYILAHNPEISDKKVTVVPNSIEPQSVTLTQEERIAMRKKYDVPTDKIVYVYGGNLGKPQNVPFIIECLKTQKNNCEVFFFIVGDGTEYHLLEEYVNVEKPLNVKVMRRLPREDFDSMVASCDVGMIFLDSRFTVPNYPSRLLSYMQAEVAVFACTDENTDIGNDIVENGFGWWCRNDDLGEFVVTFKTVSRDECQVKGVAARQFLMNNFTVGSGYETIMEAVRE